MTNCIEIKGLVKEYKTFTLGPIDLQVPGGSIMGLIGENGAGKTTLIKSMLGIVRPTAGETLLLGTDPDHAKEDIGIVLDDCFFSEYLRVKDVDSVLSRVFKGWDKGLFRDYLDKFGLAGTKNIKELSRGMRMKLSLAAALAHKPKLLLLDEARGGWMTTPSSSPATSRRTWRRRPTTSPTSTKGSCCCATRKTGCWRATDGWCAPRRTWTRWTGATWSPPGRASIPPRPSSGAGAISSGSIPG